MKSYKYDPSKYILLTNDENVKCFSLYTHADILFDSKIISIHNTFPGSWWGFLFAFAFEDKEFRQRMAQRSWKGAFELFKEYKCDVRSDWEDICFAAARLTIRTKTLGNYFCRRGLWDAYEEDKTFIQPLYNDQFWGTKQTGPSTYTGKNYLGRLWHELAKDMADSDKDNPVFDLSFKGIEKLPLQEEFFEQKDFFKIKKESFQWNDPEKKEFAWLKKKIENTDDETQNPF